MAQDLKNRLHKLPFMLKRVSKIVMVIIVASVSFEATEPQVTNDDVEPLRTITNESFKRGEILKYRIHYGVIDAGEAIVQVTNENKQIGGRNTFHVIGIGYSKGSFDWFFKVRDKYESYIDEQAILPWIFIRRVNEGGYTQSQNYVFNHKKNTVDADGKILTTQDNPQDMISAFYYARTIDFSKAKKGDIFTVPSYVDEKEYELKIKFIGRETIKTEFGKILCMKFNPVVQTGRIFKKEEDLAVWITDDKNKIPIRAQAKIYVGSIKMDLIGYTGLANTISFTK
jgi:hypothetical protein